MNSHFIHGRLARDPEFTQGSEPTKGRCNFTVATDRRYGDEADFFDCVIFGKRAGVVDKYFSKGSEIVLIGEGQIRSYEDKNGVKRRSYSVVVQDFDFCGSKRENQKQSVSDVSGFEPNDDDIPF
jgi:single-strand DNA-binding protein